MVITAALTATAPVGHPKQSTWQTKWRDIEHQLAELEGCYVARPAVANMAVRLMVEHLLKSCRELGERVWRTADLSESAVKTSSMATLISRYVMDSLRLRSTTSEEKTNIPTIP